MLLQQLVSPIEVEHAASCVEALQFVADGKRFDLVMLDWHMPDASGSQSLHMLREALPQGRIVVLSGDQSPALIRSCIEQGAAGFVSKDTPPARLLHALSMITRGGIYLPSEVLAGEIGVASPNAYMLANVADCFPALNTRQRAVLCAMAQGLPNKRIAHALTISEDTCWRRW
jgi:DNA-binding NarL/FixJ family response regulator